MNYDKVLLKIIGQNEKIEYQFSIGLGYIVFNLLLWSIISLGSIFIYHKLAPAMPPLIFVWAIFYYVFYLRIANVYAFTDRRILIYRGWLSTNLVSIDYSQITDVIVEENFFSKILTNTGFLTISTAGTIGGGVKLKHIRQPYQLKKILDDLRSKGVNNIA